MFAYIKGELTLKTPTFVIVEAGGVGYHLNISLNTFSALEKISKGKVLTYLHVKEDSQTLFGFAEDAERTMFIHLLSVSGIGPNTARIVLSSLTAEDVRRAIISEDVAAFKKVKGIGPKTAKRVILDLKDKMIKESGETPLSITPKDNTLREEALSALVALGFNRISVQKTLNKILKEEKEVGQVEELIKLALKQLS